MLDQPNITVAWLTFLTSVVVGIPTLVNIVIAWLASRKAALVVTVAKEMSAEQLRQLRAVHTVAVQTRTLVNSQMGIALALILEKAIRIANLSGAPEDLAEVEKAKQKLAEHEAKQFGIDSGLH